MNEQDIEAVASVVRRMKGRNFEFVANYIDANAEEIVTCWREMYGEDNSQTGE